VLYYVQEKNKKHARHTGRREGKKMKNFNMLKVLLETEFEDSLKEGNFSVRIIKHDNNIVFGECIEAKIEHDTEPELCINETYQPGKFPNDLYRDLIFRGWDFVLEKLSEKISKMTIFNVQDKKHARHNGRREGK
jgi:hypothetical protein